MPNRRKTISGGLRILLADDHPLMRQAIRTILEDHADVSIVGEVSSGIEAVELASTLQPDVIIMDVNMPRMDGIEATKRIKAIQPKIIVIGLSVIDTGAVIEAMKRVGADAVLLKDRTTEQLYDAIVALAD
ncbi:MAG: response regulator transcription factor [Nitrospirota bacterium]